MAGKLFKHSSSIKYHLQTRLANVQRFQNTFRQYLQSKFLPLIERNELLGC